MKAWFMQLQPRERFIVMAGGLLLGIFLLYLLAWEPLMKHRDELRQSVKEQQVLLEWMKDASRTVQQLRASAIAPGKLPAGQSLLAVVDQAAKNSGLGAALKRVEPDGQNSARIFFEQASFDELVVWLQAMQRDFGVDVDTIVLERQAQPGLINARVTLAGAGA